MTTIWSLQTIYGNPQGLEPEQSTSKANSHICADLKEAMAEYGKVFKAGLPADACFLNIYLWRSDPGPNRRVHNVVKHAHFWKDENGTHCNEYSGAVTV